MKTSRKVGEQNKPRLAQISTAAIRGLIAENCASIDVFLPRGDGDGAVLYSSSRSKSDDEPDDATRMDGLDFDRLRDHGVSHVFVHADDLVQCEQALEARLSNLLANPDLSSSDRAEIVHSAGSAVAREIINSSLSKESLTRAASLTDGIVEGVMNDPNLAGYVLQMAGHERNTASHMQMVSTLAAVFGAEVYGEDSEKLQTLALAGMLHDVGKLSVPVDVLHKDGPLTEEEVQLIQQHPIESVRLIGEDASVSTLVRRIILQHHERLDGRGYPLGLSGDDILPESRMLTIVDSFHAMIGPRKYRASLSVTDANRVMGYHAGRQFDAELLERWVELCERHDAIPGTQRKVQLSPEDDRSAKNEIATARRTKLAVSQRRPRFVCTGNTVVRCVYAGRLANSTPAPDDFGACVHDVSHGGICIYSVYPMYRGEILHVCIKTGEGRQWLRSMVAWCSTHDTNVYRVGLKFICRSTAEEIREADEVEPMGGYALTRDEPKPKPKKKESEPDDQNRPVNNKREDALKRLAAIACMRSVTNHAQRTVIVLSTSSDVVVRLKALDVMMQINSRPTRDAMASLLHDPNRDVRMRAINAVAMCEVTEAAESLRELMHSPEETVALTAAGALGQMKDWSGLRYVATALESDGPNLRLAVRAFSQITGHRFPANREGIASARRYWKARKKELLRKVEGLVPAMS